MPSTSTSGLIDQINQQNRSYEEQLAEEKRAKKAVAKANRKKKRLERNIAKGKASRAARESGWTGMVILLDKKGKPMAAMNGDGQIMVPKARAPQPRGPSASQVNQPKRSMNLQTTRKAWKLADCEIEEVPFSGDLHAFDVYMKRGGYTRVQRMYPSDAGNFEQIIRAIENGNSPVANQWTDGTGRIVCWENAVSMGSPNVTGNSTKKGKSTGKPKKTSKKAVPKASASVSSPARTQKPVKKISQKPKSRSGKKSPCKSGNCKTCKSSNCKGRSGTSKAPARRTSQNRNVPQKSAAGRS